MADDTFWPPPPPMRRHPVRNVLLVVLGVLAGMTLYGVIASSSESDKADAVAVVAASTTAAPSTTAKATTTTVDEFSADYDWWNRTGKPALTDIEASFDTMALASEANDFAGMDEACLDLSVASFPLQTAPDTEFGRHVNAAGALYQQAGEACFALDPEEFEATLIAANAELDLALAALS